MLRATLKSLLSRKLRLLLSALAVILGVMFVSGAFVLTDSLGKSFDALFASINNNIEVQVTGKAPKGSVNTGDLVPTTVPADLVSKVQTIDGVEKASGSLYANGARIVGKDGKVVSTFGAPRAGIGWTGTDSLIQLRQGHGPAAADEIAIDAALAKTTGYKVGDDVGVLTLQPRKTFKLVGIFGYSGNRDTLGGSQTTAFTMPVAQELLLGKQNVYTSIDVSGKGGISQTALRDNVHKALGGQYDVKTAQEVSDAQSKDIKQGLKFFNYLLLGFAGVALFVGIFLILNTFSMLVAQRTRELALLRAVGASRPQVIRSVLLEAVIIGLIASVVGLAAGIGIGALLAYVFGNLGGGNLSLHLGVPPSAVIAAFAVGLLVTLVAAVIPAVRASRIPPIAAMRDAATPDKPLTRITIAGAVVTAIGAGLLAWGLTGVGGATLTLILAGVLFAFIGVALLTPIISRPVVSALGRIFSWSVPGKLGRQNSARNPRRTAITAAALMVGIALVTGVSTILASATQSINKVVDTGIQADLIIAGQQTSEIAPTFDKGVLAKAADLDGVKQIAAVYFDGAVINGKQGTVAALNSLAAGKSVVGLEAKQGSLANLQPNQVVLDETTAKDKNLNVGSTVKIQLVRGPPQTYTVVGIYKKNDVASGYILPEQSTASFRVDQPSQGYVQLNSGANVSAVRSELNGLLKDSPEVTVQDRSEYAKATSSQFDTILTMIQILLALAILIAVLGIINTLALSVIERTRELGLLRAIGLRRSQMMRMITVESVVISLFGAVLGIVVGLGLGSAVVQALKDQGFTEFGFPFAQMGLYIVLAAVIGVVAAILPAIRASRLNVLNAIAYE